jgi:hypothetical protein
MRDVVGPLTRPQPVLACAVTPSAPVKLRSPYDSTWTRSSRPGFGRRASASQPNKCQLPESCLYRAFVQALRTNKPRATVSQAINASAPMGSVKSKNQWTAAGVSLNFYIAIAIAIAIANRHRHRPTRPLPRAWVPARGRRTSKMTLIVALLRGLRCSAADAECRQLTLYSSPSTIRTSRSAPSPRTLTAA